MTTHARQMAAKMVALISAVLSLLTGAVHRKWEIEIMDAAGSDYRRALGASQCVPASRQCDGHTSSGNGVAALASDSLLAGLPGVVR